MSDATSGVLDTQTYLRQLIGCGLCFWVAFYAWPDSLYGSASLSQLSLAHLPLEDWVAVVWERLWQRHWIVGLCVVLGSVMGINVAVHTLFLLAHWLDWLAAHQPKINPNHSRFARWKDIRVQLASVADIRNKGVPFWGVAKVKPSVGLFIGFQSNAYCVAPAGSGKGIYTVVPNICALAGVASKVIVDFKGELAAMTANMLRRRGEVVFSLNPSGKFVDLVGGSDSLNPLDRITDNLLSKDQLRYVLDDLRELSAILIPEKDGSNTDPYWPLGAKGCLALAILIECMVEEDKANLASVAVLIEDRMKFEQNLRWLVGVDMDNQPCEAMPIEQCDWAQQHSADEVAEFADLIRAKASNLLALMTGADRKTFDSFITQAQQGIAPFAFGSLAKVMDKTTFDLTQLKQPKAKKRVWRKRQHDGAVMSLFIMVDETRLETSKRYIELVQWHVLTVLKRHPNKHVPVYVLLDEITNYYLKGLDSLLTWGRGFGIRLLLVFQAFSAFEKTYGKQALETLHSETEIKLFLPSQRSPQTLEFIANRLLGQQSIVKVAHSQNGMDEGLSENFSHSERALKSISALREGKTGLLIVRDCPAIEILPRSYAQTSPWKDWVDINPFHGKAFKQWTRLQVNTPKKG